jgi:hypothetical protein
MNKPTFRVLAFDHATCDAEYCGAETTTRATPVDGSSVRVHSANTLQPAPTVTLRVRDLLPALQHAVSNRLSWVKDFEEDPVVVTPDLYEVLLTLQRMKRAA